MTQGVDCIALFIFQAINEFANLDSLVDALGDEISGTDGLWEKLVKTF